MNDEFQVTPDKIRKGDRIEVDGVWKEVTDSHFYMGPPIDPQPKWVVRVAKTDREWDWSTYPTYGKQPNDNYDPNGPEYVWPFDCTDEVLFYDDTPVTIVTDKVEVLDDMLQPIRWWVAVYELDQAYGGPEEGGWWVTTGTVKQIVPASSYERAEEIREELNEIWVSTGNSSSVIYDGGDYGISICKSYPKDFPDRIPVYC